MATVEKPMGPLPGKPGDWRKSPWFWRVLTLSLVLCAAGVMAAFAAPQYGGVLLSVGVSGLALAAAIGAMAQLRSRRDPHEELREAP